MRLVGVDDLLDIPLLLIILGKVFIQASSKQYESEVFILLIYYIHSFCMYLLPLVCVCLGVQWMIKGLNEWIMLAKKGVGWRFQFSSLLTKRKKRLWKIGVQYIPACTLVVCNCSVLYCTVRTRSKLIQTKTGHTHFSLRQKINQPIDTNVNKKDKGYSYMLNWIE